MAVSLAGGSLPGQEASSPPMNTPQGIISPDDPAQKTKEWLDSKYFEVDDNYTQHSELTVRDFINYLRHEIPSTAYFTNEMIDWALEAARLRHNITKSSSTIIAHVDISRILYSIGTGRTKDETSNLTGSNAGAPINVDADESTPTLSLGSLQQQYPKEHELLSSKRYVFLPVCNGFAIEAAAYERYNRIRDEQQKAAAVTEDDKEDVEMADVNDKQEQINTTTAKQRATKVMGKKSTVKRIEPETSHSRQEIGSHWSFIVIDTLRRTARYIDSLVKVTTVGKKKYRISQINSNAPVAGKILCGFDTFMNRKKGDFDARTLKWIPTQHNDNQVSNDAGACGPYMYALMDFILRHQNTIPSTLGPKGLDGYFREDNIVATKANVRFDSSRSRTQIQEQLKSLRLRKEAKGNGSGVIVHPVNLDPITLLGVLRPDALRQLLTGDVLKKLIDIHERPPEYVDPAEYVDPIEYNDTFDFTTDPAIVKIQEAMWARGKAFRAAYGLLG
jgi:hypothetical protein